MRNIRVRKKTPVTILTGFLGSGKTTLLNHLLTQKHGMKIAVIENEFGEVGVDEHLVKQNVYSEEQVIETMNGCICCTVRDDLSKVIKKLLIQEKRSFDGIIIETTGMANPTPLVQTFFLEQQIQKITYIDGIITVVDAKHIIQHLEDQSTENESIQQIAFADRIILNKIDLVSEQQVKGIKLSIRKINQSAQIIESTYSKVNPNILLGLQAFKLQNVLKAKPKFLDVVKVQSKGRNRSQQYDKKKEANHEHECQHINENYHEHEHEHGHDHDHDHDQLPDQKKDQNHHHSHDYLHNRGISSCGSIVKEPINLARFDEWIQNLISQKSPDLYRYKGVINVVGVDSPYVFQGVHQVFNGNFIKNGWEQGGIRQSSVCFIGKNLEKESLINGFKFCVASRLQFGLGDIVSCKISCGSQGWKEGIIVGIWHKGYPYLVRLTNGAEITFHDHSSGRIKLISKAKPPEVNQKSNKQKILSQTDEIKSKGIQLFHLQKYQQAVTCFAQVLAYIENNVTKVQQCHFDIKNLYSKVFKYKITCLIRMQKFQQAILNCQLLLKLVPKDPNVYYFNGICLIGVKRFNQALQKLEQAYQLDQDNEQLLSKIRQCHRIIHEQQLIKQNPKQTEKKIQKQQKSQNNHISGNPGEQIQNGSEIK